MILVRSPPSTINASRHFPRRVIQLHKVPFFRGIGAALRKESIEGEISRMTVATRPWIFIFILIVAARKFEDVKMHRAQKYRKYLRYSARYNA